MFCCCNLWLAILNVVLAAPVLQTWNDLNAELVPAFDTTSYLPTDDSVLSHDLNRAEYADCDAETSDDSVDAGIFKRKSAVCCPTLFKHSPGYSKPEKVTIPETLTDPSKTPLNEQHDGLPHYECPNPSRQKLTTCGGAELRETKGGDIIFVTNCIPGKSSISEMLDSDTDLMMA